MLNCLKLSKVNFAGSGIVFRPLLAHYTISKLVSGKFEEVSYFSTVRVPFVHHDADNYIRTSGVF